MFNISLKSNRSKAVFLAVLAGFIAGGFLVFGGSEPKVIINPNLSGKVIIDPNLSGKTTVRPAFWKCGDDFVDTRNDEVYPTVEAAGHCWMARNLDYDTGTNWCFDDDPGNCDTYGRLYDWTTASTACPDGWHLSTDSEWHDLESYYATESCSPTRDGSFACSPAGTKLKASSPDWNGDNESGLSIIMANSLFNAFGWFEFMADSYTRFWTSSAGGGDAIRRSIGTSETGVYRSIVPNTHGYVVRCVKD